MDKKSKFLIFALFILVIVSMFFVYKKSFITKSFELIEEEEEIILE